MLYYERKAKSYKELQDEKVAKIEKFFNKSVVNIAEDCKFPEYAILILKNKYKELEYKYNDIVRNILSCQYAADKRTPMEYAKDLILAWLFESYVMENLVIMK